MGFGHRNRYSRSVKLAAADGVQEECLHSMVEAAVRRTPDATALVDGKLALTYAQLDARAEAAARRLRALGVGPGSVVGLAARRRADTIAALLGVLKAGAAYLPLDFAYPVERLRFMLEDSGAAALVAGRAVAEKLADAARPTVMLEELERPGPVRAEAAARSAVPSDLAYVIYTSGSTGKPKGVMVEHASAVNIVRALMKMDVIGPGERALFFSSMSFDVSVGELFSALSSGAALFLRDEMVLPPGDFVRRLEELRIERLSLPTAYWHELSATLAPLGRTLPSCVRSVTVAGEAMRAETLDYWRPSAGRVRLINAYGPTEATVYCSFYEVPSDAAPSGIVPIGRAGAAGADLHVIDADGRPVSDDSAGELWIGGPGVARGYLNRPELTAARFVPDRFSGRPGARLYRTGDRVRRRPDGVLEYLGRFDDQVKIRGFRVELGEVESALAAHPTVGTCAVVLREENGVQRLVAYVSPASGASPSPSALRAFLADKLPEYMVPSAVVALHILPLTPAGKIDRRALPAATAAPPAQKAETDEERMLTPLQREILGIWEEVLGVSPIGLRDDFFALGGQSLLAVRMMAKIEKIVGRRPPLTALTKGMTIERLAKAMSDETGIEDGPVIRFGPENGAEPVVFVHPGLGGLYCEEISRAMPDRPVYLVAPQEILALDPLPPTEEIARRFVEKIRAVRPRGPYRLGGYCASCAIAYEMARQLEAEGESVPSLLLVAAPADSLWWRTARRAVERIARLRGEDRKTMLYRFNFWVRCGQYVAGIAEPGGAARIWKALRRAFTRAKTEGTIRAFKHGRETESDEIKKAFDWAWASYEPRPYGGPVTFLEAKAERVGGKKSVLRSLASSSEQAWLPGDHETIVTTHAAALSAEIGRRLP